MRRSPLLLLAVAVTVAACGEPLPGAATIPGDRTDTPVTTVPALPPSTPVPSEVSVERLAWEGTVTIRARLGEGLRIEGVATVAGGYAAPDGHRVELTLVTSEIDPSADSVDREETSWAATVVGDRVWFSEDGGPVEIGSLSGGDAEMQLELLSSAAGGILPWPGLLDDLAGRPWEAASVDGVGVMAFEITDAPIADFGMLFGPGLVEDPLPGAESGSLTILLDPANGVVRRARYVLEGDDAGTSIDVILSFRVTAVDGEAPDVLPPGVEPFEVPPGMGPFVDPAGRFRVGLPAGWSGEDAGGVIGFESPDGERYAAVRFDPIEPGTTADDYADALVSDGTFGDLIERGSARHDGRDWVRIDAGFPDLRAAVWLTVDGGRGIGFLYAAPPEEWGDASRQAAEMFSSFGLLEG